MAAALQSVRPIQGSNRDRNLLYVASTITAQTRCVKGWAKYIDTAFCISAFCISDFNVIDDYIPFFDKTLRKIVSSTDLLLIVSVARARTPDGQFVTSLLETRARKGLPTIVDKVPRNKWAEIYQDIVEVS